MEILALLLAIVAIGLAVTRGGSGSQASLDELRTDGRRRVENLGRELNEELEKLRQLLARVADGETLDPEQIAEGRLWREVPPDEGKRLVEQGGLHLLDVRTPQETAGGIIPGAILIPIDQLEERLDELPKDKKPMLVYCALGSRSAAACEHLSAQGFSSLMNLCLLYTSPSPRD